MSVHRLAVVATAVLFCGLAQAGSSQLVPGAPTTDWDVAQNEYRLTVLRDYNTLITEWRSTLNSGDAAAAAANYEAGALLLVSGLDPVQGRDSIASFFGGFTGTLLEIRTGLTDFLASDKLAYAAGPMIYSFREAGSGRARTVTGNHVTVLVREGRRWRIHSQVLKYELTAPTG